MIELFWMLSMEWTPYRSIPRRGVSPGPVATRFEVPPRTGAGAQAELLKYSIPVSNEMERSPRLGSDFSQPVWPSRIEHEIHEIAAKTKRTLHWADIPSLAAYGVDVSRYESFDYDATQALAAAAHFLEFDGLLVPSARHRSTNLVIFMDRDAAASLHVKQTHPVDWSAWRKGRDLRSDRLVAPIIARPVRSAPSRRRGSVPYSR